MQFFFIILDFSNKVRGLRLSFCLDLWKHFVFINYGQLRSKLKQFCMFNCQCCPAEIVDPAKVKTLAALPLCFSTCCTFLGLLT